MSRVTIQKILSIGLALAAAAWGVSVVHSALQTDDGGPPLGAICVAFPAIVLLLFAGAVWPKRRPDQMRGFDVITKAGEE